MKQKLKRVLLTLALGIMLIPVLRSAARSDSGTAIWPELKGATISNGSLMVDATGANDGYFFAAVGWKTNHRLKMRVIKSGTTLTYDLNSDAEYELFPLQLGDGYYEIVLYENVSGKKYAQKGSVGLNVKQNRDEAAFLVPNQYLNYSAASEAVGMADSLCAGMSEKEAYEAVCKFMKTSFVYDFIKAINIKPGMLPDIDGSYAKKMGVCQDLAAITVAMLRTQGIPSRLIIGYADKQYHAWTVATVNGKEQFFDPTAAISAISPVKDYSVERYY